MVDTFVSAIVCVICYIFVVTRSITITYNPMGEYRFEAFNRTLLGLISMLSKEEMFT